MNRKVKKLWYFALKRKQLSDGRTFTKAKGQLRYKDGNFCALGVLCEEAVIAGVIPPPVGGKYGKDHFTSYSSLPLPVREWAGLDTADPKVKTKTGSIRCISAINDTLDKPLEEIAELIKEL